jgi:hypothetical protein
MASMISQVDKILQGAHVMSDNPLTAYFAAKACVNANRKVGVERRFNTMRMATKNFRVMLSIVDNGRGIRDAIRLYRPDTQQEFIFNT